MSRLPPPARRAVRERARGLCEYCRCSEELTGHECTIDHILPEARGGTDDASNLCLCCFWCNSYKQVMAEALDSRTGRIVPLFNPRTDRWEAHFRWSPTGARIMGRTATGRATVQALHLNRIFLARARRVWARHGLRPPEPQVP
jgi:hypothetical protein